MLKLESGEIASLSRRSWKADADFWKVVSGVSSPEWEPGWFLKHQKAARVAAVQNLSDNELAWEFAIAFWSAVSQTAFQRFDRRLLMPHGRLSLF